MLPETPAISNPSSFRASTSRPPSPAIVDQASLVRALPASTRPRPRPRIQSQSPIGLVPFASCAFLAVALIVQFLFRDNLTIFPFPSPSPTIGHLYEPAPYSPPADAFAPAICESPSIFRIAEPISKPRPHRMALLAEAKRIAAEFEFSDDDARRTAVEFIKEMNEGLEKEGTTMSQIPTFVTGVPNGTEKGLYLAVDLGGTNFRVCSIQLHGDTTFTLTQSKVAIPKELMVAKTAKELFAFLAKQVESFLKKHHEDHFEGSVQRRQKANTSEEYQDEPIFRLGFTFSFPVHQIGINSGTLIRWTKGFDIQDAVGKDVCALLQEELDLLNLPVKVAALVNDTVGTLMARSYTSPGKSSTLLGAIFGTGTNGAYVEKLSKITKSLEGAYDSSTGEMVVNTEWGSFDNGLKVLPNTIYDQLLDRDSVNPGIQMFEKRISGMFLGEILRLVLVSMMSNAANPFFTDKDSSSNDFGSTTTIDDNAPVKQQWAVDSSILSVAQSDNSVGLRTLRQFIQKDLGVQAPSLEDAQTVKDIAHAIAKRAARLAGVAVAGIVLQTGRLDPNGGPEDIVDIGVDGSLVEFYPGFEDYMREAMRAVDGIGHAGEARIRIGIAKDGSGVGAALIALVAARLEAAGTAT